MISNSVAGDLTTIATVASAGIVNLPLFFKKTICVSCMKEFNQSRNDLFGAYLVFYGCIVFYINQIATGAPSVANYFFFSVSFIGCLIILSEPKSVCKQCKSSHSIFRRFFKRLSRK